MEQLGLRTYNFACKTRSIDIHLLSGRRGDNDIKTAPHSICESEKGLFQATFSTE